MRGIEVRHCVVLDITEGPQAECVDMETGNMFSVPHSAPGGVLPVPGDQWLVDKMGGYWNFSRCIMRAPQAVPVRSLPELIQALTERGLIEHSFEDHGGSPTGAMIGEVRWFHDNVTPDPYYWVPADGSSVTRVGYRELGRVLSPGTSTTFTATAVTSVSGPVQPHYCAR